MAERTAVWQIAADFSRARSESDKTARSLRRLREERDKTSKDSIAADGEQVASDQRAEKSLANRIAAMGRLKREQRSQVTSTHAASAADRDAAKASDQAAAASDRLGGAHKRQESMLQRLVRARQQHIASQRAEAMSSEAVVRASDRVTKASLSSEKATLALESAQRRLSETQAKHGSDSSQYANALLSVQRRENEAASAAHRLTQATNDLGSAQRKAGGSGNGLIGNIGRLAGKFFSGSVAAKAMSLSLMGIKFSAIIQGVGALVAVVSQLSAGLLSLIGPLSSVAAAAAALPQAFSVAAGAVATFMAALSGVGAALKAGAAAHQVAAKESKALARTERSNAHTIAQAVRSVQLARQNAADTAHQNAEQIKAANQSVVEAEWSLTQAHKEVGLAYIQARRDLQDYTNSLADLALQERGASLSVEEARKRLNQTLIDPGANKLARAQAQLTYDEAVQRLKEVKQEHDRTKHDADVARQKGVKGSDVVQNALHSEKNATQALATAEQNLADTRHQAAESSKAAAQAIKDAEYAVRDAHLQATQATIGATQAQNAYALALKNLSPEQQTFVKQLLSMRDTMHRLRDAAARGLLPGLGDAMLNLKKLVPLASRGLEAFGKAMGDTAVHASNLMTSGPFQAMFGRILDSNTRLIKMGGRALINVGASLVYVMDAARPFTEWLGRTVLGWTKFWRASAKAGDQNGKLAKTLDGTKHVLKMLGGAFHNLWDTFKNIGKAGSGLGNDLLRSFRRITKGWADWTGSVKGKNQLKEWFDAARPTLHQLSKLGGALMRMFFDLGRKGPGAAPLIKEIREKLLPAVQRLLDVFNKGDLGKKLIDALAKVVDLAGTLASDGGGLGVFVDTIGGIADAINALPTGVLKTFVTAMATLAALRFASKVTGVTAIGKGVVKAYKWNKKRTGGEADAGGAADGSGSGAGAGSSGRGGKRAAPKPSMRQRFMSRMGRGGGAGAGGSTGGGGAAGGGRHARPAGGLRGRFAQRNEGGFMALPGRSGSRTPTRTSGGSTGVSDTPEKAASRTSRAASKAGSGLKTAARGAGGLAAIVSTLTLALSFLPGPIGEVASKFSGFATMALMLLPLLGEGGLGGLFTKFGGILKAVGGFVAKFVGTVAKYMLKFVGVVGKALMLVGRAMMANPWMLLIAALVIVVVLVIKYWDQIKAFVMKAINYIVNWVKSHWDIIKWFAGPLVLLITLVVQHWNQIKAVFMKAVNALISAFKATWNGIKDVVTVLFGWVKDYIKLWWTVAQTIFSKGADAVKTVFSKLADGIANVWDKIRSAVSKPVEFVVNTVINDGIIKNYNKLAGLLGIGKIPEVHFGSTSSSGFSGNVTPHGGRSMKGYAKGGIPSAKDTSVYPGYTPGKDVGYIGISGGEAIMRPEWTRAVGKAQIEEWNRAARTGGVSGLRKKMQDRNPRGYSGGFKNGGVVWPLPGGTPSTYAGHDGVDLNAPNDEGKPFLAYRDGVITYVGWNHGYGDAIFEKGDVGPTVVYGHSSKPLVHAGERVKAGQPIGLVGATGHASGPHLHFGIPGGTYAEAMALLQGAIAVGGGSGFASGPSLPGWAQMMVNKTAGWVRDKVNGGIDALAGRFGNSDFIKMVSAVPKKLVDGLVSFIQDKTAGSADVGAVSGVPASQSANVAAVKAAAAKYGWASGSEWNALQNLVMSESGFRNTAQNPTSTAYGMFQFLDSTWAGVGGHKTSDPALQALYGMRYIKGSGNFHDPISAWAFHKSHGWYKDGGIVPGVADAAPVQMFARGGTVKGHGNRDTVPAMLTPGEFVVRKDAVQRVGISNLERLNQRRGGRGHATGVQHFHQGGPVLGMKEGKHGNWVEAIRYIMGMNNLKDVHWDADLTKALSHVMSISQFPSPSDDAESRFLRYMSLPKVAPGGSGAPGTLRLGTYNAHVTTSNKQTADDLQKIMKMVDVVGLQEFREKSGYFSKWLSNKNWGFYRPDKAGDAGLAWNSDKYRALQKHSLDMLDSKRYGGGSRKTGAAYVMLEDKETGSRFWTISSHAQPHGYDKGEKSGEFVPGANDIQDKQYKQLRALHERLAKTGLPVFNIGDFNERIRSKQAAPPGAKRVGRGIDSIYFTGAKGLMGKTYDKGFNSDHPFLMGKFGLPGDKGSAGAGDKHAGHHKKTKPKDHTWAQAMDALGVDNGTLLQIARGVLPSLNAYGDAVPKFMKGFSPRDKMVTGALGELNKKMHVTQKGKGDATRANDDTKKALLHVIDHALGRQHDDLEFRPWEAWTPLEASIIQAQRRNAKLGKWQDALVQIATWGYNYLETDLLGKGVDDAGAFKTALAAAGDQRLAKRLNDTLMARGDLSDQDFANLINMMAFMSQMAVAPGLRDIARHLGLSDYETVTLWEKGQRAGKFSSMPASRTGQMTADVASWRAGTYYFADGGTVPGAGNQDSVPAMLTPGEFVIKREAAKALGLQNLWALNGLQKFAGGGLVMAPEVSRAPHRSTVGVSARSMAASTAGMVTNNITYDVDIHNPIAERSTKSLTKALQRQSSLKNAGSGTGWSSVVGR